MAKFIHSSLYPALSQGDNNRVPMVELIESPDLALLQDFVNTFITDLLADPTITAFSLVDIQYSNYEKPMPGGGPQHVAKIAYVAIG